ncbi:MAG: hypothetical protein ACQ9MH_02610 [Nitrospinales bacterium]
MRKDKYNIEMEDITAFPILRSDDFQVWEEISNPEMEIILDDMPEEQSKLFLGVVRNGSPFKLGNFFYKIKPK